MQKASAPVGLRMEETLEIVKSQFPNMFLLPAFTNLYNDVPFYVPGDDGFFATPPGGNCDLLTRAFFSDGYRQSYLPFVEQIVTRFRNEPYIFAWEIGNELKLDRADKSNPNDPNPPRTHCACTSITRSDLLEGDRYPPLDAAREYGEAQCIYRNPGRNGPARTRS